MPPNRPTSIDGIKKDPDNLMAKEKTGYVEDADGVELCANCKYFIPDEEGEGNGGCTYVKGVVEANAWCRYYAPSLENPPHG